jgi:lysophospholipase L1-like esterase
MKYSLIQLLFFLTGIFYCLTLQAQESRNKKAPIFEMQEFHQRDGLPNVFHKIASQRQVRIGYIGGSITEASEGWRDLTFSWFRLKFPQTAFYQVNAAIGGTGSDLGVFRMEHDVFIGKPDLLFVEFAINDAGDPRENIIKSMEGLIRKTWNAFPNTDICFVYTTAEKECIDLVNGKLHPASKAMEELAEYYGIPSIHVGMEIARLYSQGRLVLSAAPSENEHIIVFTEDRTHPLSESGHPLYANIVVRYLEKMSKKGYKAHHELPVPYFPDNWQDAKMIDISQTELIGNWIMLAEDNPIARQFKQFMPTIYRAKPGAIMLFKFKGRCLGIYDCIGPGTGTIEITIDGKKEEISRFDPWCNNYRKHCFFIKELEDKIHEVEIRVLDKKLDKATIMLKRNITITDPAKYEELDWYPANVMIVGELQK